MSKIMKLQIVGPQGQLYAGDVKAVYAAGREGELGILPGHTQLLAIIAPGPVRFVKEQGEEELFYVSGGILEVQPNVVNVLADSIERPEDLDLASAEKAQQEAQNILSAKGKVDYKRTRHELAEAMAKLRVVKLMRSKKKIK